MNIFAGIVNCATIANGIVKAFKLLNLKVPLVVRLDGELRCDAAMIFPASLLRPFSGNNVEEAKKILQESNLPITTAASFDDAAVKAVASVKA